LPYISLFAYENSHDLCTGTRATAEKTRILPKKREPARMRALEGGRDDLRWVCVRGIRSHVCCALAGTISVARRRRVGRAEGRCLAAMAQTPRRAQNSFEWSFFRSISGDVFGFFRHFFSFGKLSQVMGEIDLDQDRQNNKTSCPEIAWK